MFPDLIVNVDDELAKYKKYAEKIRPFVKETVYYLDKCIKDGKKVLVEGANAAMLDIDFGEYFILIFNSHDFISHFVSMH